MAKATTKGATAKATTKGATAKATTKGAPAKPANAAPAKTAARTAKVDTKAAPAKAASKRKAAKGAQPASPGERRSYKELYDHYLPMAKALPREGVQLCRADVPVALANVKAGVKAVCGTAEQIAFVREHLPRIPAEEVAELSDIARALLFALGRVALRGASAKDIEKALKEIGGPREQLLRTAEVLAERGKLDRERVARIRAGSGKFDMAKDVVDLVDVFTEDEAPLHGLHPFTHEELEKLRATSEWLLENLTPTGARKEPRKRTEAEDVRDRLWTLLLQRHPDLRKIGYYLHGDDFESYTPKLQSRVAQAVLDQQQNEETAESPAGSAAPEAGG